MEKVGDVAGRVAGRPFRRDSTPPRVNAFLARVLALAAGFLLVTVGSAAAYQVAHSDHLFPGLQVAEIAVGDMTREQAEARLRPWVAERRDRPLLIRGLGREESVTAAALGLDFDAAEAVDAAFSVGRSEGFLFGVGAQLRAAFRGLAVDAPALRIDREKITAYLGARAREIDRPVRDSELKIGDDFTVGVTPSVVGRRLDTAAAAVDIERALVAGTAAVDLPVVETQPQVTEKELEETKLKITRMLSAPASLEFRGREWTLTQEEILGVLSVKQEPGTGTPVYALEEEALRKWVDGISNDIDQPRVNPRIEWNGGSLKLFRAGQDGLIVDRRKSVATIREAITGQQRTAEVPVETDGAAGASIDLSTLGLRELVDSASTTFAGAVPEKAFNIKLAASRLNGVLLAPGEVFSFNKEVGPTTLKAGYQIGFGIASSGSGEAQTIPSVAGGICQVSTTLFQSVFWAGYQVEEQYPHMYWISAYGVPPKGMIGLDATVDDPNLDFKFRNNTENYLLIQSKVEGSTVEFFLYGTKPKWEVAVEGPIITNVIKADPSPVRQEEPSWPAGKELWVSKAGDGMDVKIIRRVTEGSNVRTLTVTANYQPSRNVLMVGTGIPAEPPARESPSDPASR